MKTTIDMGKVIAKWKKDIEFHQGKIREIQNKMAIGQEIVSISGNGTQSPSHRADVLTTPRTPVTTLPSAIIKILEDSHDWLTTAELVKTMQKNGFKSRSGNFRLLVATTINKMAKKGRVARKKQGHYVLYASVDFGSNENNMIFDRQK